MRQAIRRSLCAGERIGRLLAATGILGWAATVLFLEHPNSARADEPHSGMTFQECPACPAMIVIPAGHFTMTRKAAIDGRKDDDPEGAPKRQPAREVDIKNAFALGIYPVTREEFSVFVRETHRTIEPGCYVQKDGVWILDESKNWIHPGFVQTDRHPVTCVSWNDAQEYVQWLNRKQHDSPQKIPNSGLYRLPTWEEIEYATGSGTTTPYYWGDQPQRDKANYGAEQCLPCSPKKEGADHWLYTSPVGSFPPNGFGLYDTAGNIHQWFQRCQPDSSATPPKVCRSQGLHGGSWLTDPEYLRTGHFSTADVRHRNNHIGFRVARPLS